MAKVEGSNPFIRFNDTAANRAGAVPLPWSP
jgi:hypothetical protein